jgi:hypothetical protein
MVVSVSSDGKRALLSRYAGAQGIGNYRVVDIAAHKVEDEVELDALAKTTVDAELTKEMTRARELLKGFPLGAGGVVASAPDGKRGAFNNVDHMYVADETKSTRIPIPAGYYPMVMADGKTLLFSGYAGKNKRGSGNYMLHSVGLEGGAPKKVANTDGFVGTWGLSRDGRTLRILVSDLPDVATCVVEVSLPALQVTNRRCLDGDQFSKLSPSGNWVAWHLDGKLRAMEISSGNVVAYEIKGIVTVAISDSGRMLVDNNIMADHKGTFDLAGGKQRRVKLPGLAVSHCRFRGDSDLICADGTAAVVVDLDRL